MTCDLTIALRVSPTLSRKHVYFASKYDLVETCFNSFIKSLHGLSYELIVILDNCPHYEEIFRQRVDDKHLKIFYTGGIGNAATFLYQINILLGQAKSEYVYFAEDDYFYVGKMSDMVEFICSSDNAADFITPYDHPDYYTEMHGYKKIVAFHKKRKWKQVASTTMTFLTSKENLRETKDILMLYPRLWDYIVWLLLTRKTSLWKFVHPRYRFVYYRFPLFIPHTIKNYLAHRRYFLWAPEPTIATHLVRNLLSPGINWKKCLRRIRREEMT